MALDKLTSSDAGAAARVKINAGLGAIDGTAQRISAEEQERQRQDEALSNVINAQALASGRDFAAVYAEMQKQDHALSLAVNDETIQRIDALARAGVRLDGLDRLAGTHTADIASLTVGRYDFLAPHARVGEVAVAFTLVASPDLIRGSDRALPSIPPQNLATGDAGAVVRVTGSAVVAMRRTVAVEPGRVYLARAVTQTRTNSTDPSNDAVRVAVAWLDQNRNRLLNSAGPFIVKDELDPKASQGRREVSARISRAAGEGVALVAPASARYAKLYVQTFGVDGVTDIEVLDIEDVSSSRLMDPISADIAAQVGGLVSQDLAARLGVVESQLQAPNSLTFATRGDAASADVPATVTTIATRGLAQPGDGRGGEYRRVPAGTDRVDFTTSDGALWQRVNQTINDEDIGTVNAGAIAYPADLAQTHARTLDEKAREQAKSFLDYFPRALRLGILAGTVVDAEADLTDYLQKALDSGRDLFMPPNLPRLTRMRVTKALQQTTPRQRVYWALSAQLLYDRPRGPAAANGQPSTAIEPLWIMTQAAVGAEIWHLHGDHQGSLYGNPVIGGGNLGLGSAVMLMADQGYAHGLHIINGWDNGIAIASFSLDEEGQQNGRPRGFVVFKAKTWTCGIGPHDDGIPDSVGARAGSGVNNLTGSATILEACEDNGSTTNFIQDFGGGASSRWICCVGTGAKLSPINHAGELNGGTGFYCAGSDTDIIGLQIEDPQGPGIIVAGNSDRITFLSPQVKNAGMEGYRIGGNNINLMLPRADNCSQREAGRYPAFRLFGRGDAGGGAFGAAREVNLLAPETTGNQHTYGVELQFDGNPPTPVIGKCQGGALNGRIDAYGPLSVLLAMPEFIFEDVRILGENALRSTGQRSIDGTNANAVAFPFGTIKNAQPGNPLNGSTFWRDQNDPRKMLVLGFDSDRLMGVLQSILQGDSFLPLSLNPGGGPIEMRPIWNVVAENDTEAALKGVPVACGYRDAAGFVRIRVS